MVLVSHELYWYDIKKDIYQNVDVYKFNFTWLNLHSVARCNSSVRPILHVQCVMTIKVGIVGENNEMYSFKSRRVGYIDSLDGSLYMGSYIH